jgi:hypothetical protein
MIQWYNCTRSNALARARVKEGWHDKAGDTMSGEYICSFLYLQAFVPRLFGTYLREAYLLPPHRACIYMIRDCHAAQTKWHGHRPEHGSMIDSLERWPWQATSSPRSRVGLCIIFLLINRFSSFHTNIPKRVRWPWICYLPTFRWSILSKNWSPYLVRAW